MTRTRLLWMAVVVALAVVVAWQVVGSSGERAQFVAQADIPTVAPGVDVLAGIAEVPVRIRGYDYHRNAFGDSWTDDNPAPGGHNGCDTRNDVLERDLVDKTYVSIKRCPNAVASGTLHDPYTNATVPFVRGNQVGAAVQIDHIVPLALAWDLGARNWTDDMRLRFANDPANLIAVQGQANQDKGDKEPATWMPPNTAFRCQYAMQFIAVLRGYALPVDAQSATILRDAAATCPTA
ncbi:MAG TPA: HNH endonuclease family protein [Mycobacterium sp.]|nr:HNH endonuclease family protein [Mycobacterium sp.]